MKWPSPRLDQLLLASDAGVWGDEDAHNGISVLRSTNMRNDGAIDFSNLAYRDVPMGKRETKVLAPGDIILENSGGGPKQPVGRVCYFVGDTRPHVVGNFCRRLRPNKALTSPIFLFWRLFYMHACGDTLRYQTQTTGIRNLKFKDFASQRIGLPPLSEQCRIADLLAEADRIRRLSREVEEKAARILPALFLKMFGDPATNPMHWPTDRLDHLFDIFGGGTPSKSEPGFWEGDIPWVSPKDMKRDVIVEAEDHITEGAIASSATRRVAKGSLLIVYRSGMLAHTFPVAIAGRDLTINQDLKAITTKSDLLNEYLYGWLSTAKSLTLGCVKKGATVHNIDGPRFVSLQVAKPPVALQQQFSLRLSEVLELKARREVAGRQIEALFSLLLQQAFSGQLTAKWREAHMESLLAEMAEQARLLNLPAPTALAS